jgi:hypothetical protein
MRAHQEVVRHGLDLDQPRPEARLIEAAPRLDIEHWHLITVVQPRIELRVCIARLPHAASDQPHAEGCW